MNPGEAPQLPFSIATLNPYVINLCIDWVWLILMFNFVLFATFDKKVLKIDIYMYWIFIDAMKV